MPKTRRDQSRDEKVEAILEAAERRLREGGYGALSVAALARELGLAQNSVYWYFPSKDHLFVAVVERMLGGIAEEQRHDGDAVEKLLDAVDGLAGLQQVRVAVIERSRESAVVAEFEAKLRSALRARLAEALKAITPAEEVETATRAVAAQIEGSFLQQMSAGERRKLLSYTLERMRRG